MLQSILGRRELCALGALSRKLQSTGYKKAEKEQGRKEQQGKKPSEGQEERQSKGQGQRDDQKQSEGHEQSEEKSPETWVKEYKDSFIPFSRFKLLSMVLQDMPLNPHWDRNQLLDFVEQAEPLILKEYYTKLEYLKNLYEPINPDKDSFPEETVSEGDRQDREWRLLKTLNNLLEQGNFTLLPRNIVTGILTQSKNTQVKVDLNHYEYIRFWVLAKRFGLLPLLQAPETGSYFFNRKKAERKWVYFKRVVMITRLKESHMVLKCFKDLPLEELVQTLPSVRPRFSMMDATLLNLMLVGGGIMLFINVGTVLLLDYKLQLPHILLFLLGVMGFRWWKAVTERRAGLVLQVTHILYYKSTSNNRDLLVSLSDRACEEHFKELILAQTFLRKPPRQGEKSPDHFHREIQQQLEEEVTSWLNQKSGVKAQFNAPRALANLTYFRSHLEQERRAGEE